MHSSCLAQLLFKHQATVSLALCAQLQFLPATTWNQDDCSHMSVPANRPQGLLFTEALRLHNLTAMTSHGRVEKYQIYFRETAFATLALSFACLNEAVRLCPGFCFIQFVKRKSSFDFNRKQKWKPQNWNSIITSASWKHTK